MIPYGSTAKFRLLVAKLQTKRNKTKQKASDCREEPGVFVQYSLSSIDLSLHYMCPPRPASSPLVNSNPDSENDNLFRAAIFICKEGE